MKSCGLLAQAALLMSVMLIAGPRSAGAHQHRHAAVESLTAGRSAAASRADTLRSVAAVAAPVEKPFVMPPMREALLEHLHNKLVHFPIALGLTAAALFIVGRRRSEIADVARWLVITAAGFAIAAYFTGTAQAKEFEHEPIHWLARLHGRWGTITVVAFVLWAAVAWWKPARSRAWIVGLIVVALIAVTAYLGGVLAHAD